MKFTGNFEKMGKIMYRRIFVHYINFYRLENNMKLVSWNVNGIRACITKGFEESFAKLDADIFCLQETKCQENQVKLELPGYYQYWNYANRKGYSGTAVFTKKEPLSVTYGLGIEEHDKEGRVITAWTIFIWLPYIRPIPSPSFEDWNTAWNGKEISWLIF